MQEINAAKDQECNEAMDCDDNDESLLEEMESEQEKKKKEVGKEMKAVPEAQEAAPSNRLSTESLPKLKFKKIENSQHFSIRVIPEAKLMPKSSIFDILPTDTGLPSPTRIKTFAIRNPNFVSPSTTLSIASTSTPLAPPKILNITMPRAIIKPFQLSPDNSRKLLELKQIKIPLNSAQHNFIRIAPKMMLDKASPFTMNISKISALNTPPPLAPMATPAPSVTNPAPPVASPAPTPFIISLLDNEDEVEPAEPKSSTSNVAVVPQYTCPSQELESSEDILRPWIDAASYKCTKSRSTCEKMINEYCLAALFKCMGSTCSFYTNDKQNFQTHVGLHLTLQSRDFRNCLLCAYCPYLGHSIVGLIKHIEAEHRFDLFR